MVLGHGQVWGRLMCAWSEKMGCREARTLVRKIYRDSSRGNKVESYGLDNGYDKKLLRKAVNSDTEPLQQIGNRMAMRTEHQQEV